MSKSNPDSGIFMHDDAESIRSKIKKAWCESGMTEANPTIRQKFSKEITGSVV